MDSLEKVVGDNDYISDNFQQLLDEARENPVDENQLAQSQTFQEVDVDNIKPRQIQSDQPQSLASLMATHTPVIGEPLPVPTADDVSLAERLAAIEAPKPLAPIEPVIPQPEVRIADTAVVAPDIQVKQVTSQLVDADKFKRGMNKFKRPVKASFPVVGMTSFYRARVSSISLSQKESLLDTSMLPHEIVNTRASVVYNLISEMSLGRPSFGVWKKITAINDLETFFFGIYGATYPTESEFTIHCSNKKCKQEIKLKVAPSDFVIDMDSSAVENLERIIQSCGSLEQLSANSPVFAEKKYYFGDDQEFTVTASMAVSIDRYVETLRCFTPDEQAKLYELINIVAAIKTAGYRSDDGTTDTITYTETNDVRNIMELIQDDAFSPDWANTIEKDIMAIGNPLDIKYNLPGTKCPHCDTTINKTQINPQNVLFFKLEGKKM